MVHKKRFIILCLLVTVLGFNTVIVQADSGDDLILPFNPPDANWQLAFVSERDGNPEIYAMNADGSALWRVTRSDAADTAPDWRPGHDQIVFTSNRDGNAELYAINSDGTRLLRLTTNDAQDYDPACSPDGTQALFVSDRDGNPEIYVMDIDTGATLRLTDDAASDLFPAWSPNGAEIAFVSNRNGSAEVFVMSADGTNVRQVSNTFGATNWYPAWSPNATAMSITSQNNNLAVIYTMNPQGEAIRQMTDQGDRVTLTAWSPDGGWIAFASERDGDSDLYVLNSDDLDVFRLTDHDAADYAPDWRASSLALCAVHAEGENVAVHVGPGLHRGIFGYMPVNQDFNVIGQVTDDAGTIWWQLNEDEIANTEDVNSLWISSQYVVASGTCGAVPAGEIPPFVPAEQPSGEWGSCGSCNTCGYAANECMSAPDGQCVWNPGVCKAPPSGDTPPGDDGQTSTGRTPGIRHLDDDPDLIIVPPPTIKPVHPTIPPFEVIREIQAK